jgi:RND family efflux transporter MFP subunit
MPAHATAEAREVPATLTLTGTLMADEESHVSPLVAGRVVEVLVERGASVAEGDPLVRLRDTDYRLQVAGARAQLDTARARLGITEGSAPPRPEDTPEVRSAQAQMQLQDSALERAESLAARGVFTQSQLDEARARAASARESYASAMQNVRGSIASLSAASTTLRQAGTSVTESVIRAPFAGEIAERSVAPGEYVTAASRLVTLVRTDPVRIEVRIPQEQLFAVHEGQAVEVRVDAAPDHVFAGTIRYISASVDATSRGLTVEAVIPNTDPQFRLRPGMFANARILLGTTETMAVVPASAVLTQAGVSRVFILRDGHVVESVVSISSRDSDVVVISQGVAQGDVVATESLESLADGMAISG